MKDRNTLLSLISSQGSYARAGFWALYVANACHLVLPVSVYRRKAYPSLVEVAKPAPSLSSHSIEGGERVYGTRPAPEC